MCMCGKERCVGRGDQVLVLINMTCKASACSYYYSCVCVGMGDLLVAQNDTICMLAGTHYYSCLCVRSGDRVPAKINNPCVFVREGENKCLHSLILRL